MKAKTSLTLSVDLLRDLDRMAGPKISRSSFVESILRDFVAQRRVRQKRVAQEAAAINQHAEKLNSEMSDALSFQERMN